MIPLPWLIIGWLVSTVLGVGVGYYKGGEHARTAMLAAAAEASDRAVRRFNAYSREDIEATRLAAEREGRARLAARKIQHEFEMEALHGQLIILQTQPGQPPAPAGPVRLSAAGLGLLNDAIATYNAAAAPASGSGNPVPADGPPEPRQAGNRDRVDAALGQYLRLSRHLRTDAPGIGRLAASAD
jgi:hypothetical protein